MSSENKKGNLTFRRIFLGMWIVFLLIYCILMSLFPLTVVIGILIAGSFLKSVILAFEIKKTFKKDYKNYQIFKSYIGIFFISAIEAGILFNFWSGVVYAVISAICHYIYTECKEK